MADEKLTQLPSGSTPDGSEVLYAVQSGASRKFALDTLLARAHTHTAATLDSGAATDGQVLTADGAGGAAWENPTGGGGVAGPVALTEITANTTLDDGDHGKVLFYAGVGSITVTLHDDASDGFECAILNTGTGTVSFAVTGGDTIKPSGLTLDNTGSNELTVASIIHQDGEWFAISGERVSTVFAFALSDESSSLTTGTGKTSYHWPHDFVITGLIATVNTAPTDDDIIVDVNVEGSSILSTKLSIDDGENTSETAATPPVLTGTTINKGELVSFDIDQVGSSVAGTGLKVSVIGYQP